MIVPVVWRNYATKPVTCCRGFWDMTMLEDLFADKLWQPLGGHLYVHHDEFPDGIDGAIVVLPASHEVAYWADLNRDIAKLKWVIVVLSSDEDGAFPYESISHPNMRVWVMYPRIGRHDKAVPLVVGYTPAVNFLKDFKDERTHKPLDWFFSGQITHTRRNECVAGLKGVPKGALIETPGFSQGLGQRDYIQQMAAAKIAPCPSGPCSQDTFRVWEALEAGCLPIVDDKPSNRNYPAGYWKRVTGKVPFPVLDSWEQAPAVIAQLLADWPANTNRTGSWWASFKRDMVYRMRDDVCELSGTPSKNAGITVVIPTSPIPSHPDTRFIEEAIQSVRYHLPTAEIIIMMDGVRPSMEHRRAQYEEYKRRLIMKCQEWTNVLPVVFTEHKQQSGMLREVIEKYVKTPLLFFVEHDAVLTQDYIDWNAISKSILSGEVNMVRLYYYDHIHPEHAYLMRGALNSNGIPFIKTVQYSQWPNIASTEFYRGILSRYFPGPAHVDGLTPSGDGMIETVMYGPVVNKEWDEFKIVIYNPDPAKRFIHRNGRENDPADW